MNQQIVTKVKIDDVEILKTISNSLNALVKRKGKTLSWLRFAKKTNTGGFHFMQNKEEQWSLLEECADRVAKHYPEKKSGEIADLISELVNTKVTDCLFAGKIDSFIKLSQKETQYLNNALINVVGHAMYVPHYYTLYPQKQINQNNWISKDLKTGRQYWVIKKKIGIYYQYEIKPKNPVMNRI